MTVFNLNNLKEQTGAGVQEPPPAQKEPAPEAIPLNGEQKQEPPTNNQNQPAPEQKKVEIVVSGPLGHIYTQALNQLLAKEDAVATVGYYEEYERKREEEEKNEDDKSFVYVADGSKLGRADMVKAFDAITQFTKDYPNGKVVVGLESHHGLNSAASSLCNSVSALKIPVYFKNASITNAVKNLK